MTELTNRDFFYCYTLELSQYLKENGIPYILKSKSIKDDNIFTLYQKTEQLQSLLDEYKKLK